MSDTPLRLPNYAPPTTRSRRLAIVAEAPTRDDLRQGRAFTGHVGMRLRELLGAHAIDLEECFQGHVCQVPPPSGRVESLRATLPGVQEGLAALKRDLAAWQPHMVLLLCEGRGSWPLRLLKGDASAKVAEWRGSVWELTINLSDTGSVLNTGDANAGIQVGDPLADCAEGTQAPPTDSVGSVSTSVTKSSATYRCKALALHHPADYFRDETLGKIARFDVRKCVEELRSDELVVPQQRIEHDLTLSELHMRIAQVRSQRTTVAYDIEGGIGGVGCIGFATSASDAFIVPFAHANGESMWSEDEEVALWEATAALLEDPLVPKVGHNLLYDNFVLAWTYGIVVRGVAGDTMVKHHELYCELEKSLAFCTSIYTRQPFYKIAHRKRDGRYVPFVDGRPATDAEWYRYCGLDCCCTYEINEVMERQLTPPQRRHYQFNIQLLTPLLFMELRGIRYDEKAAKAELKRVQRWIYVLQDMLNREAARGGARPALAQFFRALGVADVGGGGSESALKCGGSEAVAALPPHPQALADAEGVADALPNDKRGDGGASDAPAHPLIPLVAAQICVSKPRRRVEVEERTWQPMRWNGKKWVKAGKRVNSDNGLPTWSTPPENPCKGDPWLKPIVKRLTRSVIVMPRSWEDCNEFAKVSERDKLPRIRFLSQMVTAKSPERTGGRISQSPSARGELSQLLGINLKVNASGRQADEEGEDGTVTRGDEKDANWFLYEHCAFPKQFKKEGHTTTDKLASDDEALIKIWVKTKDWRPKAFLRLRRLLTQTRTLKATPDDDGRIRCGFNIVGTETGRLSCYQSPTGSGYNLQTVTKPQRHFFQADEGCLLTQCDLAGADGWTVSAYAAMLGDRTMLDDYIAGMKPAKIIALMWERGAHINKLDRATLKQECKSVDGDGWKYFASKRIQHGTSYAMGRFKMSDQILTDSFKLTGKPVHVDAATCERIQKGAFFVRYPGIARWHEWMARELRNAGGRLTASNGFTRIFFGRKDDKGTVGAALAHLPQVYTTESIKQALGRMWGDAENRRVDGTLRVEPLLTVHDSIVDQCEASDAEFSKRKHREWYANKLVIAGQEIVIPFEGAMSKDWSMKGGEAI